MASNKPGFALGLQAAAAVVDGAARGGECMLHGVSTDTRSLQAGELFVALRGPSFDGHAFLDQARERGAAACMVEPDVQTALPRIEVNDTRQSLGRLAAAWRARFAVPVVGVTGSNGKTSVKEMLAAVFAHRGAVLATRGNLNNDIGVPLTLLGLDRAHEAAVIEMGANHPGEIAALTRIARPNVGVVTNAGAAHLEGFGNLEGVARAKGELFAGLPEDGVAVINSDDGFAPLWRELAGARRCVSFGMDSEAELGGEWTPVAEGGRLQLRTPTGEVELTLSAPGRHNAMNALAAAAAAYSAGASLQEIRLGLEAFRPAPGRLQFKPGRNGGHLLDDTYNANPDSLQAAFRVLTAQPGRHWLALGDMGELGPEAAAMHERVGVQARDCGVQRLYAAGELAAHAARGFGAGAVRFADAEEMAAALAVDFGEDVTLLVKGSRRMRMERVVEALSGGQV